MTLVAANSASVAALYWSQTLVSEIAADFSEAGMSSLVPAVTLAGYATGAALIAFGPAAWGRSSIERHLLLLVIALAAVASAPNVATVIMASYFVGCGSSVAQRLLATAAQLVGPAAAGRAIGGVICGSLTAVLGVRLIGQGLGQTFGWRPVFLIAAATVAVSGFLAFATRATRASPTEAATAPSTFQALWRSHALLRRAAFQQAALFAAFNAGWMTVLVEIPAHERPMVVLGGCCAGLAAALAAGRLADRPGQRHVTTLGAAAMLVSASLLLPIAYGTVTGSSQTLLLIVGMALLDAGMQVALVSNQARVQALQPFARVRLAATLTVCGFLGGACGAGAGYWLTQAFNWQAAIGFAAVAACLGLACSLLPAMGKQSWVRRPGLQPYAVSNTNKKRSETAEFLQHCRNGRHLRLWQGSSAYEGAALRDGHTHKAG